MASRMEEKERLREVRLAKQQEEERLSRRQTIAIYAVSGVLAAASVAGIVVLLVSGSGGGSSSGGEGGPFGQHYSGLEARRTAAGVTTMATPDSATHIHPLLAVYVNGKQITVPSNIGIPP